MLGFICGLYTLGQLIKEAFEPTLPAEYHGNSKLEEADINKVRFGQMSQREFNRNLSKGKYYAPICKTPPLSEGDRLIQQANRMREQRKMERDTADKRFTATEFRDYLSGRAKGWMPMENTWGKNGEYEFIKKLDRNKAEELLNEFLGSLKEDGLKYVGWGTDGTSAKILKTSGWEVECFLQEHNIKY